MHPARTVTKLLQEWKRGDASALDELMPLVYGELERLAAGYLKSERPNHTFHATDLVSEAYLRLSEGQTPEWNDRVHFFAVAARTMRNILVDHARRRGRAKRNDGQRPVAFDDTLVAGHRASELVALDDTLNALAAFDERKARIVELHYFGGLTQAEIAEALELHVNTVARDLKLAEAWIHKHMHDSTG
jgi:RNA polymerase sigma factor (TIGR02999 family)